MQPAEVSWPTAFLRHFFRAVMRGDVNPAQTKIVMALLDRQYLPPLYMTHTEKMTLAREFGVSDHWFREALTSLTEAGILLRTRQGLGYAYAVNPDWRPTSPKETPNA
jgi:predicted DNA-binding transcriptional regulator